VWGLPTFDMLAVDRDECHANALPPQLQPG